MSSQGGHEVRDLIRRYEAGALSRRTFVQAVMAAGVSGSLASLLATRGAAALQSTPEGERTPSGELTAVLPASLISLDPHGAQALESPTTTAATHLFDTLVVRNPVTSELEPQLATSWEASNEGRTWTFTLRDGVTFHDGSPFTANDVKASLERVLALEGPLAPLWALVDSVEAPDDTTVVITTTDPLGTVPANASLLFIGPADQMENEGFFESPVGVGPFMFESWQRDAQLEMRAFPDYWDGPPGIETLIIREIPEVAGRVTALATGEIDFTYSLPPDQLPALRENPDLQIDSTPTFSYYFVWFNAQREPFTDPRVRRAMIHALDIDTMVTDLLEGVGVRAEAPIPSTVFGFVPQEPYAYDPELARELLAEAGYPDGFETSVIWVLDSGPQNRELLLTMIAYWDAIGVRVESLEQERATWLENLLALNWDMDFQTNSVRTGDADFTLRRLYTSSANRTGYANEELDQVLIDAAAAAEPEERLELYAQANEIIWEDAVGIFPFELLENYVYQQEINDFVPPPSTIPNFADVVIEE